MPAERRALLIGLLGPAIQAIGFAWEAAHLFVHHLHAPADPRHLFFEGGVLLIGVGFLVSVVLVPVAIEVARASPADLGLKMFEALDEDDVAVEAPPPRHRARRAAR